MNRPFWEVKHDWAISDICFELEQIYAVKLMLRKHPSDSHGDKFREIIKDLKKLLAIAVKNYEIIYGDKPNVRRLREEIER